MNQVNIHPTADVKSSAIGEGTVVWQFAVILERAVIGCNCNINCHTFIENDVTIGDHCTIKSGVYLWDGISIGNHVFIGPNVTFTNDKFPKSKVYPSAFQQTVIEDGVSIGAGSVILGGVRIGKGSLVGAGSLVTKSIGEHELWMGSPARFIRKIND